MDEARLRESKGLHDGVFAGTLGGQDVGIIDVMLVRIFVCRLKRTLAGTTEGAYERACLVSPRDFDWDVT